uniref:EXPERA domain-containing protein n=1 Tax=Opuntia streptacantha TaxID=393608 RepID=A0A7C9CL59_OPUST
MGCVIKLIDAVLFLFFLLIALVVPLFDAQICLPQEYYPKALLDLSSWYSNEYGDYLVVEKPNFFVGLVWLELFVIWPLSIVNLFGLLSAKSWFNTTCLIYGASITTSMVAILSELIQSSKASEKLLMVYYPFLGLAVLAVLRGLLPVSCKTATFSKRPVPARKKRA